MEDTFHSHKTIFSAEYLMMFSELWVCETYEFMRVMKARELYPDKKHEIDEVYNQLKLLRIPLDKHEIASDRKIKEPIKLIKHPIREGDTPYEYNSNDSLRSHIMPRSFSSIGSAIWQVTDIKTSQSYWIERRSLSNKLLKLKTA